MLPFCVTNGTGQRIADLAAARQFQQQEAAGALDGDRSATDNSSTFTDGDQGGAIDVVPQLADGRMGSPPVRAELLYLVVGEPVRLEFAPGIDGAHVAKGEITDFANGPFRTVLRVGAGRDPE